MDYEKKYKEALEVAQRFYNSSAAITKKGLEDIFPELKESEDARIRKGLIEYFLHYPDHEITYYGLKADLVIAWLEKQGEQKSAWSEKYIADVFEKVGLAKIVREQSNDNLTNALQDAMIELSKFTPQPKQEWSEEDELRMENILSVIEGYGYPMEVEWLKSLKDRVQPKQDWNEDGWTMQDEEELQIALDTLVKAGQHSSAKWLKNVCLRPQNHWKPSDEQMNTLEYYMYALTCSEHKEILFGLYEDLKKLKG